MFVCTRAFNLVSNFAYGQWSRVVPEVQRRIVVTEAGYFQQLAATDGVAIQRLRANASRADVVRMLTDFTVRTGNQLVDQWNQLFGELFVRFSDG